MGALLLLLLQACGQYTLIGKVVAGDLAGAQFVPADDPRLAQPGVSDARVSILRDPDSLKRAIAGSAQADALGMFELPVEGVGAGWMVEQWLIRAERNGYQASASMVSLPANPRRMHLLITIRRGAGPGTTEENLLDELERYR